VKEQNIYASETGFDGFYMALLKKKAWCKAEKMRCRYQFSITLNI
jgi:hypothetical protein